MDMFLFLWWGRIFGFPSYLKTLNSAEDYTINQIFVSISPIDKRMFLIKGVFEGGWLVPICFHTEETKQTSKIQMSWHRVGRVFCFFQGLFQRFPSHWGFFGEGIMSVCILHLFWNVAFNPCCFLNLLSFLSLQAPAAEKLPVLYLVDSIVKNVGGEYLAVFAKNLITSFICVFEKVQFSLLLFSIVKFKH